jgi:hypothetical protein
MSSQSTPAIKLQRPPPGTASYVKKKSANGRIGVLKDLDFANPLADLRQLRLL